MVVIHPLPWPYRMSMEAGNGTLEPLFSADQVPIVPASPRSTAPALMHAIRLSAANGIASSSRARRGTVERLERQRCPARGASGPTRRSLVHAHRGHGLHPGANDNGSGLRHDDGDRGGDGRPCRPRRSVEFLCTTAEEGTTPGVAAYIESRRAEGSLGKPAGGGSSRHVRVGGKLKLVELGLWPDTDPDP